MIRPSLRSALVSVLALLAAAPALAQSARTPTSDAVRRAVETITEVDFGARLGVIADDSMRGRATPSPELDETAAYIADAFRRFGLQPGGDGGTFVQRYRILRSQMDSNAAIVVAGRGTQARWALGRDASLAEGTPPDGLTGAPVVLMAGLAADTARPFGDLDVRGAVVFQVLPLAAQMQQGRLLAAVMKGADAGVRGWVFLFNIPAPFWARIVGGAAGPRYEVPGIGGLLPLPLYLVRDSSAADVLRAAGEDLAALRDTSLHIVRPLAGITVAIEGRKHVVSETTAPNVVGILEGSDPQLRDEYVLVTGHMDHVGVAGGGQGCVAQGADSICNGADDDGSGTIGVVELAQAFSQLTPRPRRTMIFVTVSGEERGLWGSQWFAQHPTRPLAQAAANLNLDMIGRNARDSLGVVGKQHSTLGEVTDRITREHPDLGMQLVDDPWHGQYYRQSDHYSFARLGVPAVFFFNGVHPELHSPRDALNLIDAEKAARALRMIFYVALDVANAAQRPQWDPAARRQIVQAGH